MPVNFLIFAPNALDVNGPVAIMVMVSFCGISNCSILLISISGCEDKTSVKDLLNFDLSTAKAPPAGTETYPLS